MARAVSTATLISRIRARGDVRENRHPDATIVDWIDESWAELYDLMVSANPDYFMSSDTVSVVSGTASYSLPSDFYILVGVTVPIGGQNFPMRRFNWNERHRDQLGPNDLGDVRYRIKGSSIYFAPTPASSATVTLYYIPAPTKTAAATGDFDGISGWEEYVVSDVCMKAAMADEEDYKPFLISRENARKRIMDMATTRDTNEPDTVRDVENEVDSLYRYM